MKLVVKVVTPLVALLVAATAAVAVADPVERKEPYPEVPANATVCLDEKLEVTKQDTQYQFQLRKFQRATRLFNLGNMGAEEYRKIERELHEVAIKLNAAVYKEAACRNREGNDAKKACVALVLELQAMVDELPMRKELERLAAADFAAVKGKGSVSVEEQDRLETAAKVAEIERKQLEQRIADKRKAVEANPACKDFPIDRPVKKPAPPKEEELEPSSTSPAQPTTPVEPTSPADQASPVEPITVP